GQERVERVEMRVPAGGVAGRGVTAELTMIEDQERAVLARHELDAQNGFALAGEVPFVFQESGRFDRADDSVGDLRLVVAEANDDAPADAEIELDVPEPPAQLRGLCPRTPELLGAVVVDALEANAPPLLALLAQPPECLLQHRYPFLRRRARRSSTSSAASRLSQSRLYFPSQASASASGDRSSEYTRRWATPRDCTSPCSRSTRRWRETAGRETLKCDAISPASSSRSARSSTIRRRVGSASAARASTALM